MLQQMELKNTSCNYFFHRIRLNSESVINHIEFHQFSIHFDTNLAFVKLQLYTLAETTTA